eukprot:gene46837-17780_t
MAGTTAAAAAPTPTAALDDGVRYPPLRVHPLLDRPDCNEPNQLGEMICQLRLRDIPVARSSYTALRGRDGFDTDIGEDEDGFDEDEDSFDI